MTVPAQFDPERLALAIAHEATRLLAPRAAGQAASPLMGEGLAVWVSGCGVGVLLDEHAKRLVFEAADPARVLGADFTKHPESETYPHGPDCWSAIGRTSSGCQECCGTYTRRRRPNGPTAQVETTRWSGSAQRWRRG